jgi:hypothetical protein
METDKKYYIFPSGQEKFGKNAMLKTISNAFRRFKHALNKYYVQRGLSPLNRFGYITPNEWETCVQQHTTPKAIALSNKMKELNAKNKFWNKLGPEGYKVAMWSYGVLRCSISLTVVIVFRDISYVYFIRDISLSENTFGPYVWNH